MILSTEKYEKTKIEVKKNGFMPHINHMTTSDGVAADQSNLCGQRTRSVITSNDAKTPMMLTTQTTPSPASHPSGVLPLSYMPREQVMAKFGRLHQRLSYG